MRVFSSARGSQRRCSRGESLLQAVAHAADRLDAVGADLGAQVTHVHLDHIRARVRIESPRTAQKLLTAEHLVGVPKEPFGEGELAPREVVPGAVDADPARLEVELQAANPVSYTH